jgi:urease accessory protein
MADHPLPRATTLHAAGTWPAEQLRDTVTLDFDDRHRRRKRYSADGGLVFLLDLAEAQVLRDGDGLAIDGGGFVRVAAAPEPLIEVTAEGPDHFARLAWHLGNRHLPVEIAGGRILIRHDHVILQMLAGLGATVRTVQAPFNPEGGAYGEHNRAPDHPHGHGHDHDH